VARRIRRRAPHAAYFVAASRPASMLRPGINGFVWTDLDGDGFLDNGEPRLSGWTVRLVDSQGEPVNLAHGPPTGLAVPCAAATPGSSSMQRGLKRVAPACWSLGREFDPLWVSPNSGRRLRLAVCAAFCAHRQGRLCYFMSPIIAAKRPCSSASCRTASTCSSVSAPARTRTVSSSAVRR